MEKRKQIPKTVYDRIVERLNLKKSTIKIRIYRGDLAILEMVKSEIKIYDEEQKAKKAKAKKLKKQLLN